MNADNPYIVTQYSSSFPNVHFGFQNPLYPLVYDHNT